MTLSEYFSGFKEFVPDRLRALPRSVFRREKVFVLEKKLTDAYFRTEANVQVDVRIVQCCDFSEVAESFRKFKVNDVGIADFVPSAAVIKDRIEMGHVCIVAELNENLVHLQWIAFSEAYAGLLERKMRMISDSAFLYGWYTLPQYRGLGILPKALEKAFNYLYGRGIRKVYTCISHDIFPSLKAADKVGFRKIGAITYTKIFKLRLYQCTGETEEDYSKLKWMFSL